jgi:hypothetical protein
MFGASTPTCPPSTGNRSRVVVCTVLPVVQNVHAMRPEVRAGYEAARERVDGDTVLAPYRFAWVAGCAGTKEDDR